MTTFLDSIHFPPERFSRRQEKIIQDTLRPPEDARRRWSRMQRIMHIWDAKASKARDDLEEVQKLLKKTKEIQEVNSKTLGGWKEPRISRRFGNCNRQLHGSIEPKNLVSCYRNQRNHIRVEDEVAHNVRMVDGIYKINPDKRQRPFKFRDNNGLLILGNLEIYKNTQDKSGGEFKNQDENPDNILLFNRNWALTEENKGKSFQEFIRR